MMVRGANELTPDELESIVAIGAGGVTTQDLGPQRTNSLLGLKIIYTVQVSEDRTIVHLTERGRDALERNQ